jgi:hypothetical protein
MVATRVVTPVRCMPTVRRPLAGREPIVFADGLGRSGLRIRAHQVQPKGSANATEAVLLGCCLTSSTNEPNAIAFCPLVRVPPSQEGPLVCWWKDPDFAPAALEVLKGDFLPTDVQQRVERIKLAENELGFYDDDHTDIPPISVVRRRFAVVANLSQ